MKQFIKAALAVGVMAVSLNTQAAVNFTADPESGATLETLSMVTVNATTGIVDWASSLTDTDKIKTYKDGEDFGGVIVTDNESDYTVYYLNLSPTFTTAGTYTVEIPAGILMGFNTDDEYVPLNDETVTLTYNISGGEGPVVSVGFEPNSIYPESGSVMDLAIGDMDNISLTFNSNVTMNGNPKAVLANETGSYNEEVDIIDFSAVERGTFIIQTMNLFPQPSASGKYTVTVPAKAFTDGINYSAELKLEYEIKVPGTGDLGDVTVESIELVNGDEAVTLFNEIELAALENGSRILFNTSDNMEVGYIQMTIIDRNPLNPDDAQRVFEAHALRTLPEPRGIYWTDEETPFLEVVGTYTLQQGHTYDVEYFLYDFETPPYSRTELANGKFTIVGTTATYEYSDITIVSINPEPGTTFNDADEGVITITFDGPVKINDTKSFFRVDYATRETEGFVTMSEDNTVATLQYPAYMLEDAIGPVDIYLYITDMEGRSLFFGLDDGEESYLQLEYNCYLGTPDLTVEPASGQLEEFDHIVVSYVTASGNQSIAWANNVDAGPVILTDLGSKAARVFGYIRNFEPYEEGPVSDGMGGTNDGVISVIGYLENAAGERIKITAPGSYVLTIPAASFNMGDGFFGYQCKQTYMSYTIEGEVTDETLYDFLPESKEVELNTENTVATVVVRFNQQVETNPDVINEVALYDIDNNKLDAKIENFYDMEDYNMWTLIVEYAFEEDKEYTLVVPQGSFGDVEWASDASYTQYCQGHANPEFTVTIDTSNNVGVTEISADAATNVIYNLQGIKVGRAEDLKTLPAGIYILNGVKTVVK